VPPAPAIRPRYVALCPRLAGAEPFYLLDPRRLTVEPAAAADRTVAARIAPVVGVHEPQVIDLIVCGSLAVNQRGARLGKGAGYSDIEFALLTEAGLVGEQTTIVTTVHEVQVLEEARAGSRLPGRPHCHTGARDSL
jgi:5-formyltetrahydrofolate cyclo-ligase